MFHLSAHISQITLIIMLRNPKRLQSVDNLYIFKTSSITKVETKYWSILTYFYRTTFFNNIISSLYIKQLQRRLRTIISCLRGFKYAY